MPTPKSKRHLATVEIKCGAQPAKLSLFLSKGHASFTSVISLQNVAPPQQHITKKVFGPHPTLEASTEVALRWFYNRFNFLLNG